MPVYRLIDVFEYFSQDIAVVVVVHNLVVAADVVVGAVVGHVLLY